MTRTEAIAQVAATWASCTACPLSAGRRNVVPGEIYAAAGNVDADADPLILIAGEAPGTHEDAAGKPYVGPAGKILRDDLLQPAGVRLALLTTLVACRPPGGRIPTAEEIAACRPRIEALVQACRPAALLTIGRSADLQLRGSAAGLDKALARVGVVDPGDLLRQGHPSPATGKLIRTSLAKLQRLMQRADLAAADGAAVDPTLCRHDPVCVGSWQAEDGTLGPTIWACKRCALFVDP